eukprot:747379-Hanusia_phi.AAC.4
MEPSSIAGGSCPSRIVCEKLAANPMEHLGSCPASQVLTSATSPMLCLLVSFDCLSPLRRVQVKSNLMPAGRAEETEKERTPSWGSKETVDCETLGCSAPEEERILTVGEDGGGEGEGGREVVVLLHHAVALLDVEQGEAQVAARGLQEELTEAEAAGLPCRLAHVTARAGEGQAQRARVLSRRHRHLRRGREVRPQQVPSSQNDRELGPGGDVAACLQLPAAARRGCRLRDQTRGGSHHAAVCPRVPQERLALLLPPRQVRDLERDSRRQVEVEGQLQEDPPRSLPRCLPHRHRARGPACLLPRPQHIPSYSRRRLEQHGGRVVRDADGELEERRAGGGREQRADLAADAPDVLDLEEDADVAASWDRGVVAGEEGEGGGGGLPVIEQRGLVPAAEGLQEVRACLLRTQQQEAAERRRKA